MNDTEQFGVHWSFWLVTALLLIWNVMGAMNFVMQMNPEIVSSYRDTEQAIIRGRPLWATFGFGLSVFGGTLGCIFLLLKKSIALYIFVASLVGSIMAVVHSLTLNISFGIGEIIGIILLPVAISGFLVWYAKYTQNKGWVSNT